ncbi:hypothetical protein AURDEDRAFT_177390 [Auricularia subglabra TFB-10046 SS5]|uniref:Uncharacterized protein n=1 Tax=Auricularia subglabra (strain TFB-10046 / SS5) TaxID=717982 RepID=J0LAT2_AURST|nr:hypothetical protein AURDEDRAFT_177390 [Auricularia subglabra TFB-10046 SS5]
MPASELVTFSAFLFPIEGKPSILELFTMKEVAINAHGQPVPFYKVHPGYHFGDDSSQRWSWKRVDEICSSKSVLKNPFVIFYRTPSSDGGQPALVNNLIVAKYTWGGQIINCSASDFPLVRLVLSFNYPDLLCTF